jgi:hypothetical protein
MVQGFKVAFTAVITTLLALYAPLLSLNAYSTTLSEVVYEGLGYKVTYKSPLIPLAPGNKTSVVLEVKRNGKPIDFGFTLSGITVDGARDVARGRGHGRASADITGYVDDVVRVLREANSNPAHSGLGLLTFIVSKVEEDGEEYIATDVISIPVIPGKARGKNIVVEVEFKPVHKVKLNKTSGGDQARMEQLQTTPPGTIPDGECYGIEGVIVCYWWELKTVHYRSRGIEFVPLSISYIDDIDGDYVEEVSHQHIIRLGRTTVRTLSFDLSLVFSKVVDFIVPGPGYVRTLPAGSSEETLFEMICPVTNLKVTSRTYDCLYFSSSIGRYAFYDDALVATGFYGYLWLVEYEYVKVVIILGLTFKYVLDKSLAVYLVPYEQNGRFRPGVMFDDDPTDGYGDLEQVYRLLVQRANTTWKLLPKKYANHWYVAAYNLTIESKSTPLFGIAIPVGALIVVITGGSPPGWALAVVATLVVGFSVSETQIEWYKSISITIFRTITNRCFNPHYLRLTAFLIKEAGDKYYPTPLMIVWPYTTTSC